MFYFAHSVITGLYKVLYVIRLIVVLTHLGPTVSKFNLRNDNLLPEINNVVSIFCSNFMFCVVVKLPAVCLVTFNITYLSYLYLLLIKANSITCQFSLPYDSQRQIKNWCHWISKEKTCFVTYIQLFMIIDQRERCHLVNELEMPTPVAYSVVQTFKSSQRCDRRISGPTHESIRNTYTNTL